MPELKLENVSYRYKKGERDVLSGVTCTFESGYLNMVVGPSGSGKTTLLSIVAGLDSPKEGKVTIDGDDLSLLDLDRYRRERVSMIFQAFHLFPLLTVIENVCYPMERNGVSKTEARARSAELLEKVGITADMHNRYPSNLSGGEQQRVAIVRALSTGSKVLLADEPTGNLDGANGQRVIEILRELAYNEGLCVIIVTHNLGIIQPDDRVFKLSSGVLEK